MPDPAMVPLVGRDRELTILRDRLDVLHRGQGSLVLLEGEAGIGKTALAETIYREAADQKTLVLVARCYDLTETPPYAPWHELLDRVCTLQPTLPSLHDLSPPSLAAAASQEAFFIAVRDFLVAISAQQPVLLLLEDIHWADTASLDLLRFLARSLASTPILLVATFRGDELPRRHRLATLLPLLEREADPTRIAVRRLSRDDIRALIHAHYDLSADNTDRLTDYLVTRATGNPFFVTHLLRALEMDSVLRPGAEGWAVGDLTAVTLPIQLRQVIDARVMQLDEEAQESLAIAAVIGQVVPFALWAAVTGEDEEALLSVAEAAIMARLLEAIADGSGLEFVHALVRETLYEGILSLRRRGIHRRIAAVLAAERGADPDAVASHFQRAGDPRAVAWLIAAAERAEGAFAYHTAAERYEAALALLARQIGDPAERGWLHLRVALLRRSEDPDVATAHLAQAMEMASAGNDPRLTAYAQLVHSYMLAVHGAFRDGFAEARAGTAAVEALPPASEVQRAREAPFAAFLHGRSSVVWLAFSGRFAEARAEGERVLADAAVPPVTPDDATHTAVIWAALAFVYAMQGELALARRTDEIARVAYAILQHHRLVVPPTRERYAHAVLPCLMDDIAERERVVAETEEIVHRRTGMHLPGEGADAAGYVRLPLLIVEGRWQEARDLAAAIGARNWSYTVMQPLRLALGEIARAQGDQARAWQLMDEIYPGGVATEPGDMHIFFALPAQRLAIALALDSGDLATARTWLEGHDRWLAWSGAVLGQAENRLLWAEYARASGDRDAAREQAARALIAAVAPRQPLVLLATHRLLGALDTDAGDFEAARDHLDAALALADACRAPYERALTLLALAALHAAMGDLVQATAALDAVRALCTPLAAPPALARADALAAQIAAAPAPRTRPPRPTFPAGLSAREVEVLHLVAEGLNNPRVAEQLSISPRTVDHHLTSIYNKLGVTSRAAAIRFALDHHLA